MLKVTDKSYIKRMAGIISRYCLLKTRGINVLSNVWLHVRVLSASFWHISFVVIFVFLCCRSQELVMLLQQLLNTCTPCTGRYTVLAPAC